MTTTTPPSQHSIFAFERSEDARLSLPLESRIKLGLGIAVLTGFPLGGTQGSLVTGLRFRAENAHRLPKTQTGWYLYHRSKNYQKTIGAVKEGARMAFRLSVWTAVFIGMEEGIDRARLMAARLRRGDDAENYISNDFISTALAGIGTAGAFSAWNQFPLPTSTRMAKAGLKVGLVFGLTQDIISVLRGRRVGYAEFVKRITGRSSSEEATTEVATG